MLSDYTYNSLQNKLSALLKKNTFSSVQYERGILAVKSLLSNTHKFFGKEHSDEEELEEMLSRLQEKVAAPVPYDLPQRSKHQHRYTDALNDTMAVVKDFAFELKRAEQLAFFRKPAISQCIVVESIGDIEKD